MSEKTPCWYCEHRCLIKEGETGACGIVGAKDGALELRTYGRPVAVCKDPIEKKNIFHFRPGSFTLSIATVGCNMACTYCTNWQISQESEVTNEPHRSPESLVQEAIDRGCEGVCFTYTEPTVFLPYALDIMKLAKAKGLYTVWNTNGYMTEETLRRLDGLLDAANVDLKGWTSEFYRDVCRASPEPVVRNIRLLSEMGVWIEVSSVFIEGSNDAHHREMAQAIKDVAPWIPWHVHAVRPQYKLVQVGRTKASVLGRIYEAAKEIGLEYVYAEDFKEDTHCAGCSSKLVKRQGFHFDQPLSASCPSCRAEIPGIF